MMFRTNRFIGGILLVSGTAIGAGMLALPVITSFAGFFPSCVALVLCWLFMFATAYLILEVNLACPGEANMITMAGRTLGAAGKAVCWVVYLLLLYSLTAAYIAGSSPLFVASMNHLTGGQVPSWIGPFPLLILFGVFVYFGTRTVDYVNRLLMVALTAAYFALIIFLPHYVNISFLSRIDSSQIWMAIPVLFTSFGFHIVIPSLTTYLHHDAKKLRLVLFIGSIIPLCVYLLWEFLILGIVPLNGENSLASAWAVGESGAAPLASLLQNPWISSSARIFSFFAIVTSFLGVSLSLSDFLGDGLKMHRFTWGREVACLMTFLPPLAFVLAYPRGFMLALQYAGLFVAILLGILPALMAWRLSQFRRIWGRILLLTILFISLFVIGLCIVF